MRKLGTSKFLLKSELYTTRWQLVHAFSSAFPEPVQCVPSGGAPGPAPERGAQALVACVLALTAEQPSSLLTGLAEGNKSTGKEYKIIGI